MTVLHVDDAPALADPGAQGAGAARPCGGASATGARCSDWLEAGGIDIVALDHLLAAETGLDILARKSRDRRPPIVYVTGSADARVGGRRAGKKGRRRLRHQATSPANA